MESTMRVIVMISELVMVERGLGMSLNNVNLNNVHLNNVHLDLSGVTPHAIPNEPVDDGEPDGETRRLLFEHIRLCYAQRYEVFSEITSKAGTMLGVLASLTGVLIAAVALLIPIVLPVQYLWIPFKWVVGSVGLALAVCAVLATLSFMGRKVQGVADAEKTYRLWHEELYELAPPEVAEFLMENYARASEEYGIENKRKFRQLKWAQCLLLVVVVAMAVALLALMAALGSAATKGVL